MAAHRRRRGSDGRARVSNYPVHCRLRPEEPLVMTNVELHLRIVGVLLLGLVILNLYVPRRFNWKAELATLTLLNRQIFQVHAAFICVILTMFAGLTLFYTR